MFVLLGGNRVERNASLTRCHRCGGCLPLTTDHADSLLPQSGSAMMPNNFKTDSGRC